MGILKQPPLAAVRSRKCLLEEKMYGFDRNVQESHRLGKSARVFFDLFPRRTHWEGSGPEEIRGTLAFKQRINGFDNPDSAVLLSSLGNFPRRLTVVCFANADNWRATVSYNENAKQPEIDSVQIWQSFLSTRNATAPCLKPSCRSPYWQS